MAPQFVIDQINGRAEVLRGAEKDCHQLLERHGRSGRQLVTPASVQQLE